MEHEVYIYLNFLRNRTVKVTQEKVIVITKNNQRAFNCYESSLRKQKGRLI